MRLHGNSVPGKRAQALRGAQTLHAIGYPARPPCQHGASACSATCPPALPSPTIAPVSASLRHSQQVGTFEGGSSGSGFVDLATQRLVGVLSGGAGHYCGVGDLDWLLAQHQKPNSPYGFENYGRLQKARAACAACAVCCTCCTVRMLCAAHAVRARCGRCSAASCCVGQLDWQGRCAAGSGCEALLCTFPHEFGMH